MVRTGDELLGLHLLDVTEILMAVDLSVQHAPNAAGLQPNPFSERLQALRSYESLLRAFNLPASLPVQPTERQTATCSCQLWIPSG